MAKRPIQDFYAYFVDNLQADSLLHYLRDRKWLTPDECDTLSSGQIARRQKVEKILLLLPRKSTSSFDGEKILVECIIWSGQQELTRKLGYTDHEINEISKRNPSATNPVPDIPGHGYADAGAHMGYTGQASYTGYAGQASQMGYTNYGAHHMGYAGQGNHLGYTQAGYGQPQHNSGAVGMQHGGATGYGGHDLNQRIEVGPSVIIYSQDDDPDDGIEMLARLLRNNGVDCDIDQYHTEDKIPNWDQWWERKVRQIAEQNGFILLVCSPTLMQRLSNSERICMKEGSISCQLLSSLIENRRTTVHLIPIFFDHYNADWMPMSLTQRRFYALMLHSLTEFDLENIKSDTFVNIPQFECVASLWRKLTGQPEVERPPIAQMPRIPRPVKATTVPVQESLDQTSSHSQPDEVTSNDIPALIHQIRVQNKSWSKLAVRLKVPMKKISEIRNEHATYDQACKAMFQFWLTDKRNPLTRLELENLIAGL